jgi:hypothetical protein
MGLLSNTVSICQFRVVGDLPAGDLGAWAGEKLAAKGFQSIEHNAEELSVGWVQLDDTRESGFANPAGFCRDHWLTFTLRRDQRKVPPALLKAWMQQAERQFLSQHPGLQRVPKAKREELKEAVFGALLAKTLPAPAVWDAVWDTRSGILTLASLSAKVVDQFETLFKQTFEGFRMVAFHPYSRAEEVAAPALKPALEKANQASGDGVLELIRDNRWLGRDLLLWLMFRTMNADSVYQVCRPGQSLAGEGFVATLNDRLVLVGGGEAGVQKIAVTGPQDSFGEVVTALRGGKEIQEAVLYLEKGEHLWRLNLKGEVFAFASFKSPSVKPEKDALTDEASEQMAVFYERMAVLEEGLQLFDSLFATFLAARLGEGWGETEAAIKEWLERA